MHHVTLWRWASGWLNHSVTEQPMCVFTLKMCACLCLCQVLEFASVLHFLHFFKDIFFLLKDFQ